MDKFTFNNLRDCGKMDNNARMKFYVIQNLFLPHRNVSIL